MIAAQECPVHGWWVDDGTTDDCPECIAEDLLEARLSAATQPVSAEGRQAE